MEMGKPPSRAPGDTGPPKAGLPGTKYLARGGALLISLPARGQGSGSVLSLEGRDDLPAAQGFQSPSPHPTPPAWSWFKPPPSPAGTAPGRCVRRRSDRRASPGCRLTGPRAWRPADAPYPRPSCGPLAPRGVRGPSREPTPVEMSPGRCAPGAVGARARLRGDPACAPRPPAPAPARAALGPPGETVPPPRRPSSRLARGALPPLRAPRPPALSGPGHPV